MNNKNEFKSDSNGNIFNQPFRKSKPASIIKNDSLKMGIPKKIETFDFSKTKFDQSTVSAIEENGQIKGFVFECPCGEVVEVLLDYDELNQVS
jgi:hypothetical protein